MMKAHFQIPALTTLALASTLSFGFAQDDAAPATEAPAAPAEAAAPMPKVKLETSKGDIVIELNEAKAPISVKNFLGYVKEGFYDNTVFHRVIDGFMIQGGGFGIEGETIAQKEPGKTIKNEGQNGLKNVRGSIAMARTSDPDSATAQFFINVKDNSGLDHPRPDGHGYAVFGMVVEGLDVVDAIKATPTGMRTLKSRIPSGELLDTPMRDVPASDIIIKKASVVMADAPAEEAPADAAPADAAPADAAPADAAPATEPAAAEEKPAATDAAGAQ